MQITFYTFLSPLVSFSGITFTNHSLHWAFFHPKNIQLPANNSFQCNGLSRCTQFSSS